MDLIREDGMQYKPYLTKIKNIKLVSEDENSYTIDAYISHCCTYHGQYPLDSKGIRYPKYVWKLVGL